MDNFNKIIAASLMIAGTSIGAGMLSMPLNSLGIGFPITIIILVLLFIIITITSLYFLEAYRTIKSNNIDNGIISITEEFYGKSGKIIATTILILLLYSLNSAYIAGGADLIYGLFPKKIINQNISYKIDIIVFTSILFIIMLFEKKYIFLANKIIFLMQNIIFIIIIYILLPKINPKNLLTLPSNNLLIISTIPFFAVSFGFHSVIPSIYQYLNTDIRKIRVSIIIGTSITLITYIMWQIAITGNLNNELFFKILEKEPNLNGILKSISQITQNNFITELIRYFELFAIITSFIGATLSIINFLNDISKKSKIKRSILKIIILACTFLPSLFFAIFYKNGFIFALKYASIYFSILSILIPALIFNKIITQNHKINFKYLINKTILILIFLIGLSIIFIPYLIKLNLLPDIITN